MITSFFPGRIRLRAPIFKDIEITNAAREILETSPAITNVQHNPTTGSVLLEYEEDKIPFEKLTPLVPFLEKLRTKAMFYNEKKRPEILTMLDELRSIVQTWN
ncbi:MAG: hypothetical protein K6E51_00110 [Treponema sp.]|nr:hypothetical protein [Treponema sp.]